MKLSTIALRVSFERSTFAEPGVKKFHNYYFFIHSILVNLINRVNDVSLKNEIGVKNNNNATTIASTSTIVSIHIVMED